MSMRNMMATAFGALLTVSAMSALAQDTKAEDEKKPPACCTAACEKHASGKMRCSLTGKTVETCCCVHKEGKLHCTLADKDVETCCCTPETGDTAETDQTEETDQTANEKPKE